MASPSSKALTGHLRALSKEAESIADDGEIITKAEALAMLLWQYALGWEEADPDDPNKTVMHRPAQWAIQMVYDRLEGKAPAAIEDGSGTMTAADKVSELAKTSVNALTVNVVGPDGMDEPKGPPPYRGKSDE